MTDLIAITIRTERKMSLFFLYADDPNILVTVRTLYSMGTKGSIFFFLTFALCMDVLFFAGQHMYSQLSPCEHAAITDAFYYGQNPDPQ